MARIITDRNATSQIHYVPSIRVHLCYPWLIIFHLSGHTGGLGWIGKHPRLYFPVAAAFSPCLGW